MSGKQSQLKTMYSRHVIVSVCDLNQWAMDFEGNYNRIKGSILEAKRQNSSYRLGPELETCGYSCEDHFLELDTVHHNYELLAKLLDDKQLYGIVIDIGCLVHHSGVRYNSRAILVDGKLICIRPKTVLANDSNYHEGRWFTPWRKDTLEEWAVPPVISDVTKQHFVPIGVCLVQFNDTCIGMEICEELFVPYSLNQIQVLNGAEIITNGSGSHFERGKLKNRFDLVLNATKRSCCAYMYSNLTGCDGGRLYFDGGSFISSCGKLLEFIPRFELPDVGYNVRSAYIDLDEVKGKRSSIMSMATLAASAKVVPKIKVDRYICKLDCFASGTIYLKRFDDPEVIFKHINDIYELINASVCWLWDYLYRSGLGGFYLALSGGIDSCVTALLVYVLCNKLYDSITKNPKSTILLTKLRKVLRNEKYYPESCNDICRNLLVTSYIFSEQSSPESQGRFRALVEEISASNYEIPLQEICNSLVNSVSTSMKIRKPMFKVNGGTHMEDLALQNVQARIRMVISYLVSQLHCASSNKNTQLIVLGTSNADESISGYFTKYDCSSADVNMIGDMGKEDIRNILKYVMNMYQLSSVNEILKAVPSAELVPVTPGGHVQSDEIEIGLTYEQLAYLRYLRKVELCGPVSMFRRAAHFWCKEQNVYNLSPTMIAELIKLFFIKYGKNRHKATSLPPCVHLDASTPDDNRADFRQFLYNPEWNWQFSHIDVVLKALNESEDLDDFNPNHD